MAKKKSYEKMTARERKLDAIKQSAPREIMPRPAVFEDRTKYKRSRAKNNERAMMRSYTRN